MVAAIENQVSVLVKEPPKLLLETRPSKVVKKAKEKRQWKGLQPDAVFEAIEDTSTENDSAADLKEKKPQGIVIDGKTYTCATCKTGHRVGVCKHAKERPMTATHPPGRPPAGAPKKIVCDCPRLCNCKKRDCKCARKCSCTQTMYMLVYLPAPGEEDNSDDEKGTWKLGEQVTTDLKGNVLSAEQIKERQRLKVAQKTQPLGGRTGSLGSDPIIELSSSVSPNVENSSGPVTDCCTHKRRAGVALNVAAEELKLPSKPTQSSADGCNCGVGCTCAFCPEHPNNPTSMNIAAEQFRRFANQPHDFNEQFIIPISPTATNRASCMGGQPLFAMSNFPHMPTLQDMAHTFQGQGPGYMISYPMQVPLSYGNVWQTPTLPTPQQFMHDPRIVNGAGLSALQTPLPTPRIETPPLNFTPELFDIGNASVTSAGLGLWTNDFLPPDSWPLENPAPTPTPNNGSEPSGFFVQPSNHPNTGSVSISDDFFHFGSDGNAHEPESFFTVSAATHEMPAQQIKFESPNRPMCCGAALKPEPPHERYR